MVALPTPVDVAKEAGQGGSNVLIPNGEYQAVIVKSELKQTSTGGTMVVLNVVITQGDYKDTEFVERCNIINQNVQAQEIGRRTIANIGKSIGLAHVTDTAELHNKPLIIKVEAKKQDDWKNDKGETIEGKERSEIKQWHPITRGAVQAAPAQEAAPQEAPPAADAAPVSNPFAAA